MHPYQQYRPEYLQDLDGPLQELASAADAPADVSGQPGKIRTGTWIMCALAVAFLAMIAAGDALMVLGIIFGALFFIIALAMLIGDLRIPAVRGRARPEDAILCYFRSVQGRRWKNAFACLSPMASSRDVQVPNIPELQTSPMIRARISPALLGEYWRTVAHAGNSLTRRIKRIETTPLSTEGTIHVYRMTLSIEYYPTLILLSILASPLLMLILWLVLRKTYVLTFNVVVYKHRSQWWLLSGELPPVVVHPRIMQMPQARVHMQ